MAFICTTRKLKYLSKIAANENNIAYRAFSSLVDDVESLGIINECRELEGRYSLDYTSRLLTATTPDKCESLVKELEKTIFKKDFALQVTNASQYHQHLCK